MTRRKTAHASRSESGKGACLRCVIRVSGAYSTHSVLRLGPTHDTAALDTSGPDMWVCGGPRDSVDIWGRFWRMRAEEGRSQGLAKRMVHR